MLFDEIKQANVAALKNRDRVARALYEVLIGKCQLAEIEKRNKGEEFCDADVIRVMQKLAKELAEEKANYERVGNAEEVANISKQQGIVEAYLPKMMSEEEILAEINKLDDKSIGAVMRHFKQNFAGKCDMAVVQRLAK